MRLHQYGSGNITGTVTQRLGVTSAGQVVEIPIGAGALDGSGTAGKLSKFTDADTLGDSVITESGGNIGIGDSTPNALLKLESTSTSESTAFFYSNASKSEPSVQIWQDGAGSSGAALLIRNDGSGNALQIDDGSAGNAVFTIGNTGDATFAGDVTVTGGDVTLGTDSIGSTLNSKGDILSLNVDSDANGAVSANLQFKISSSEKMRLNNTGLGIGLNSFSSPLAIKSNSGSAQTSAISIQANGSTDDIIRMGEKSTNGGRLHMFDGGVEKIAF
jgi:hypothetical protein